MPITENKITGAVTKPTMSEVLREKLRKEDGDVVSTLNSIRQCIYGILDKQEKVAKTDNTSRTKGYKGQIKQSKKYLNSLFQSLNAEIHEAVKAERDFDRCID
jgi:hypothetical protein